MSATQAPKRPARLRKGSPLPEVDQAGSWIEYVNKATTQTTSNTKANSRNNSPEKREAAEAGLGDGAGLAWRVCSE